MEMRLCKQASKPCRSLAEQPQPWPSPGLLHIPAPALSTPDTPRQAGAPLLNLSIQAESKCQSIFCQPNLNFEIPYLVFFLLLLFYFESLAVSWKSFLVSHTQWLLSAFLWSPTSTRETEKKKIIKSLSGQVHCLPNNIGVQFVMENESIDSG